MVAILADYRVRDLHGTTPFDAVSDAKSVFRYLRQNAALLDIDPERIAGSGGSAGGHLAAAAAMAPDLDDPVDDLSVSPSPQPLSFWALTTGLYRFQLQKNTEIE